MNKPPSQRMLRVGELVRHALANLLARGEIIDPLIENTVITVPEVRMSPDLKLASAYIVPLGGTHAKEIVKALNSHQKFIRGQITPQLNLKYSPLIRFFEDDSFDEASRIDSLLRSERVKRDLLSKDDEQNGEQEES
jgi:ribosome-binding factor A